MTKLFPIEKTTLNDWRKVAGDSLMADGFNNFKNLYNGNYSSVMQWDIKQLKEEQTLLQPIHEKHLKPRSMVDKGSSFIMNGGSILKYKDRIKYGCSQMGYEKNSGCTP